MKTLPSNVAAMLAEGRYSTRLLLLFDMPTGLSGVWTDTYPLAYGGVTYAPVGDALQFGAIPGAVGLEADVLEITTTGTSQNLNALVAGDWHQRPATLFRAFLDDAGNVIHVETKFAGFLDHVSLADVDGGRSEVALRIESNARELNRAVGRTRADSDQRTVDADDAFYSFVGAVAAERSIYWGRKGPQSPFGSGNAETG